VPEVVEIAVLVAAMDVGEEVVLVGGLLEVLVEETAV